MCVFALLPQHRESTFILHCLQSIGWRQHSWIMEVIHPVPFPVLKLTNCVICKNAFQICILKLFLGIRVREIGRVTMKKQWFEYISHYLLNFAWNKVGINAFAALVNTILMIRPSTVWNGDQRMCEVSIIEDLGNSPYVCANVSRNYQRGVDVGYPEPD